MRLYLDTNILVYMLLYKDELQGDVARILYNFENTLLTSSVCAAEMVHLCQIGKIGGVRNRRYTPRTSSAVYGLPALRCSL